MPPWSFLNVLCRNGWRRDRLFDPLCIAITGSPVRAGVLQHIEEGSATHQPDPQGLEAMTSHSTGQREFGLVFGGV